MNVAMILSNGTGSRFGSNTPKQYHQICGKMIVEYVVQAVLDAKKVDKILLVGDPTCPQFLEVVEKNQLNYVEGGDTRNRSIQNGLDWIFRHWDCEKLIILDSVRPMVPASLLELYLEKLDVADAVVTASKITDSLGCYDQHITRRERYYLMASPEAFRFSLLYKCFDSESTLTEVTQMLPEKSRIDLYFDFRENHKITYPEDVVYLECLLEQRARGKRHRREIAIALGRLSDYLYKNYPDEAERWAQGLDTQIDRLLHKWDIQDYSIKNISHFGIILLCRSTRFGECAIKIIPGFIDRYESEHDAYNALSDLVLCPLLDSAPENSALLLKRCDTDTVWSYSEHRETVLAFFRTVMQRQRVLMPEEREKRFKNYSAILHDKLQELSVSYRKEELAQHVRCAVELYDRVFEGEVSCILHGDLHRYNMLSLNGRIIAVDPIGYIAPISFEYARYIGTELTDNEVDRAKRLSSMLDDFGVLCGSRYQVAAALYIDAVFRLHNSYTENTDTILTDKWFDVLSYVEREL